MQHIIEMKDADAPALILSGQSPELLAAYTASALYRATISDEQSLKRIACPIIFLSPANDFHGHIDDLQRALGRTPPGTRVRTGTLQVRPLSGEVKPFGANGW